MRQIEDCPELNLSNYDPDDVARLNDWAVRADAEIDRLHDALASIQRYGLDTLSGRTDGPDDRAWQRAGINEMTKRARLALEGACGVTAFQPLAPAHVADPRGPEFTRINQHDAIVHPAGVMEALPCAIPTWQEQQEQHDPEHDFAQDKWMQDEIDALRAAMRTRGVPATPPDNRTRPLTDQSQPWTPEHCKTYPRRAAEEIEYLRGQLATLGVMVSDGSQR